MYWIFMFECLFLILVKFPIIDLANRIVKQTLEIIEYYNPHYCQYSNFGYWKRTRIWTCVDNFKPQLCPGKNQCSQMIPGTNLHKTSNGYYKKDLKRPDSSKEERYRLPQKLVHELFNGSWISPTCSKTMYTRWRVRGEVRLCCWRNPAPFSNQKKIE
jgi:hypothetical protein